MSSTILFNKKKYNFYKKVLLILLFLLILYIIYYFYKKESIENFEDKFNDHEKYEEIYDDEFVNFYEIIYRDYSDIDNDLNIVYSKTLTEFKNSNNVNFLVCGCGIGKLCKKIKEKFKNVIGVDISENMLKKGQYVYPNVKFVRGNIAIPNIFKPREFTHIYIDERTLYYNKYDSMEEIIKNTCIWLKDDGYLIVPIYDHDNLNPASRYYSSQYMDDRGNLHGFTYLNDFSHDCYYIKDSENDIIYNYYDKIILDTGDKRIKKTTFYIYPKEKIYDIILNNGFELVYINIEKTRVQIVGTYELAIFKRKKTTISVDELEKNKLL
jgi:ubiquinone/menaquinone biosynthesis C-methylase UbiE